MTSHDEGDGRMEFITTGATILVAAMGLKLFLYGVNSLGTIIKRGDYQNGKDDNKELDF